MARILGVGIATIDIINTVDRYPLEDEEVRAKAQRRVRGGNATNTLVALSQLGHHCSWLGTYVDDANFAIVRQNLCLHGIDYATAIRAWSGSMPISTIIEVESTGSRTIVHYRDLPELHDQDFQATTLQVYDWLHFEGRNIEATRTMMAKARGENRLKISLEVEKPRADIESLFDDADLILFSKHYAQCQGFDNPERFLLSQKKRIKHAVLTCAWGKQGAGACDGSGRYHFQVAPKLEKVLDTVGAGDVFNAGFIHGMLTGHTLASTLADAVQLASKKCSMIGLDQLR